MHQPSETLRLPPEARSSSASRRFVESTLSGWELEALADTAVLLTSELVTNAIVHAQTDVAVTITRDDPRTVTVSVSDGSAGQPRLQRHAPDSATGRGLGILDTLASSWRVIQQGSGKTVVFTLHHAVVPEARAPRRRQAAED
jgi:anti-sigma regulatory factor (Ser/Thr protein kinase)